MSKCILDLNNRGSDSLVSERRMPERNKGKKISQQQGIRLSERWTRIASILPNSLGSGSNHPQLYVDPNGFRRVVAQSLKTCRDFLDMLQLIEDGLEKRIPGVTSFYYLTMAKDDERPSYLDNFAGMVCVSGQAISMVNDGAALNANRSLSYPNANPEPIKEESAIFEKIGNTFLYKNRKLEIEEYISLMRAINIMSKLGKLRRASNDCITTFGALDEVLEVGKVFSKESVSQIDYYGEHAIQTQKTVEEDKIPIYNYWSILTSVNRIRTVVNKLEPQLVDLT